MIYTIAYIAYSHNTYIIYIDINAWKTHHLWNQRRLFILKIHKLTPLPLSIAEMVSDFCFHSDILVTTNKNKLVGIYPDTARLHTVAEFSKSITGIIQYTDRNFAVTYLIYLIYFNIF